MKNVLIVDDDEIFNFLSTKTLQRMGVAKEIHTALNGKEAMDLINNYFQGTISLPDVILLDLNMPVMDGFGFLEAFKKLTMPKKENIRIIVVSSSQDAHDVQRAKDLGAWHYIFKPLTEENLRIALADDIIKNDSRI
jgi:CheY-like chemotaxis protein